MITYKVLTPEEINDSILNEYIEINYREYPDFTKKFEIERLKHNLNSRGKVIVIAGLNEHNQLVGWLMVSKSKKYIENHFNMVVDDKYQRRGVGRALLSMGKEIYDELCAVVVPVNNFKKEMEESIPAH